MLEIYKIKNGQKNKKLKGCSTEKEINKLRTSNIDPATKLKKLKL